MLWAAVAERLELLEKVEEGKLADLVILDANPIGDISNIRTLSAVIRDGKLVDPVSLPAAAREVGPARQGRNEVGPSMIRGG
jgi:hypothetical protein